MRFEAKHQYFKKLASVVRNYTNIAYTLAKQHQIRQCWELAATDFMGQAVQCSGELLLFFSNFTASNRVPLVTYLNLSNVGESEAVV